MPVPQDLPLELPDPRRWPAAAPVDDAAIVHGHVERALAASDSREEARADEAIDAALDALIASGAGLALSDVLASAASPAAYRHLWRRLALREAHALRGDAMAITLFAIPVVLVAGREAPRASVVSFAGMPPPPTGTMAQIDLSPTIGNAGALATLLREHGALGGNEHFALSNVLADAAALDVQALPRLIARARARLAGADVAPIDVPGASIRVADAQEGVHLRFLVGSALSAPTADVVDNAGVVPWGMPFARALSAALAPPGVTVLALPRAPQRLVPALAAGRAAQRDVALQVFAGHALRRLRATVGEPTAVVSAHRAEDAVGGGELRVSLSSPFGPREAEGFRFPLAPYERVPDALVAITDLLGDCRVIDVRVARGVRADRDPATGLLRFCRPDECAAENAVH